MTSVASGNLQLLESTNLSPALLCERYTRKLVFTAFGPRGLISLNPPPLSGNSRFSEENFDQYRNRSLVTLTAHPFKLARIILDGDGVGDYKTDSKNSVLVINGDPGDENFEIAKNVAIFLSEGYVQETSGRPEASNQRFNSILSLLGAFIHVSTALSFATQIPEMPELCVCRTDVGIILYFVQHLVCDSSDQRSLASVLIELIIARRSATLIRSTVTLWQLDLSCLSVVSRRPSDCLPRIFYVLLTAIMSSSTAIASFVGVSPQSAEACYKLLALFTPTKGVFEREAENVLSVLMATGLSRAELSEILNALMAIMIVHANDMVQKDVGTTKASIPENEVAFQQFLQLDPISAASLSRNFQNDPEALSQFCCSLYRGVLDTLLHKINSGNDTRVRDVRGGGDMPHLSISIFVSPGGVTTTNGGTLATLLRNYAADVHLSIVSERFLGTTAAEAEAEGVVINPLPSYADPNTFFKSIFNSGDILSSLSALTTGSVAVAKGARPAGRYGSGYQSAADFSLHKRGMGNDRERMSVDFAAYRGQPFEVTHQSVGRVKYCGFDALLAENAAVALPFADYGGGLLSRLSQPASKSEFERGNSSLAISAFSRCWTQHFQESVKKIQQLCAHSRIYAVYCLAPSEKNAASGVCDRIYLSSQIQRFNLEWFSEAFRKTFKLEMGYFLSRYSILRIMESDSSMVASLPLPPIRKLAVATLLAELGTEKFWYHIGDANVYLDPEFFRQLEIRRNIARRKYDAARCIVKHLRPIFRDRMNFLAARADTRRIRAMQLQEAAMAKEVKVKSLGLKICGVLMFLRAALNVLPLAAVPSELETRAEARRNEIAAYNLAAVIQLQTWWRMELAKRLREQARLQRLQSLAISNIRNVARRYLAQLKLEKAATVGECKKEAAICIQRVFRGWICRRAYRQLIGLRAAIFPIKRIAGHLLVMQHRLHMNAYLKANKVCRSKLRNEQIAHSHATLIQKCWKGQFVRRKVRILVECAYKCQEMLWRKLQRARWLHICRMVLRIQRFYRARLQLLAVAGPMRYLGGTPSKFSNKSVINREDAAARFLLYPLKLYQGILTRFWLKDERNVGLIPLTIDVDRAAVRRIYQKTFAMPLLDFLHGKALSTWAALQSLPDFQRDASNLLSLVKLDGAKKELSICAAVLPGILQVKAIHLGGHHALVLIREIETFQSAKPLRKRSISGGGDPRDALLQISTKIYAWGWNDKCQLTAAAADITTPRTTLRDAALEITEPISLLDCEHGTCDVRNCGPRYNGFVSQGCRASLHQLDYTAKVIEVGAGDDHSIALVEGGLLFAWGCNIYGQCGCGPENCIISFPRVIDRLRGYNITSFSVGARHNLAVCNGHVFAWGNGALLGLNSEQLTAEQLYWPEKVLLTDENSSYENAATQALCGRGMCIIALAQRGQICAWGKNNAGQCGGPAPSYVFPPKKVTLQHPKYGPSLDFKINLLSCGADFVAVTASLFSSEKLFIWGAFRVTTISNAGSAAAKRAAVSPGVFGFQRKKISQNEKPSRESVVTTQWTALKVPCLVDHATLWAQQTVTGLTCGQRSHVLVLLSDGVAFGFDEVVSLNRKSTALKSKESEEASQHFNFFGFRDKLTEKTAVVRPTKLNLPAIVAPQEFEPCLYSYRRGFNPIVAIQKVQCSENSYGDRCEFVLVEKRHQVHVGETSARDTDRRKVRQERLRLLPEEIEGFMVGGLTQGQKEAANDTCNSLLSNA